MTEDLQDGGGHAEDIFGTKSYEVPIPPKKEFLPWHRPRKQFVRDRQWRAQVEALLEDVNLDDGVLRYFGLPGSDLLDLRFLHSRVCEPKNLRLRFLGFNSSAGPSSELQPDLNVSLDEVRRLSQIDPRSDVVWDDFIQIANDSSIAWKKARDHGPFDVVNLDLCDGFGAHAPAALNNTHYNAVNRLLSLQARHKRPWLLLLTTRAGKHHVNAAVLQTFLEKYVKNLIDCEPFRTVSSERFAITDQGSLNDAAAKELGLPVLILTGISKWLLNLVVKQQPPSTVEVRSVIGYRVDKGCVHEDLFSIAFRFAPTFEPVIDPLGLALQAGRLPDECALSAKALKRISHRRDADAILAQDPNLLDQMIQSTAALLEVARYDVEAYLVWAHDDL